MVGKFCDTCDHLDFGYGFNTRGMWYCAEPGGRAVKIGSFELDEAVIRPEWCPLVCGGLMDSNEQENEYGKRIEHV